MRTLHIAAMPFPSQQGTQALVHAMLESLSGLGHETHLLCYPRAGFSRSSSYRVHRSRDVSRDRSLRSGPSLRKVVQDAQLIRDVRRLHERLAPECVVAHHVEAALAAHLAQIANVSFVAHTGLAAELPSYFAAPFAPAFAAIGRALDLLAARPAARCFAISPLLQANLTIETGRRFELLVPPWRVHAPIDTAERKVARQQLELEQHAEVVLYAGNLDDYQGLDVLGAGLAQAVQQRATLRWLLATDSDPRPLLSTLPATLRARTVIVGLSSDLVRRRVHAASDLALVPRKVPGGLPIKLLDALAHGLPVLAAERASAGFEFGHACLTVTNDQPAAWSTEIARYFDLSPEHRRDFASAGRRVITTQHTAEAFARTLLGRDPSP